MTYFFILGSNPTLSLAELSAIFHLTNSGQIAGENVFILKTDKKINAVQLIKKLGGTIKIGKITAIVKKNEKEKILPGITKLLKPKSGKFKFGFSYYGQQKFNIQKLAMAIKKFLREKEISCRWVTSREKNLSSVVVEQNKLITQGIEIALIENNKNILIGQTLAVQPFKELSFRDYGRPARDDYAGMLPPKLAQIMINLSQAKPRNTILDPFCGSGTILTEAMLMGYQNLIGSDISAKAINDTKKNISWIKNKFQISLSAPTCAGRQAGNFKFQLHNKDIAGLSKFILPKSIDAIITEPYLGPSRGKFNIKQTMKKLENLYSESLNEFKKMLKPDGRIVMVWPIFQQTLRLSPNLNDLKIISPMPQNIKNNKFIKLTTRKTIIYGRPGQKIWREIVILTKSQP
jgi:tRNA G10  N-methylase Trm11